MQDNELPVFRMKSYIRFGYINDNKENRGLTSMFMAMWRNGGSDKYSPSQTDEELEFLSASIGGSAGKELSTFSVTTLQKDIKEVLDIYFSLLLKPEFDKERLEILRKNALNTIKRRNEKALKIASREYGQSLYGENSPHAWLSTPKTINKITQSSLKEFYKNNISPNRMIVAASSPLSFDDFIKEISPYIKDWKKKLPLNDYKLSVDKKWEKSTEFIHKEGNQSAIVLGHFGEKRFNKDKFKIILADEILGGSTFGSKLGDRIRSDLGLAYSIRSNFGFGTDFELFNISTQTKSESTVDTIKEIQNILKDMVENKNITNKELELARERIINRLIFEYDVPFNMVTMRLTYDYYGYPQNYLKIFQKEIQSVKLAEVKAVLNQYFHPDKLKIMIVGDKNKVKNIAELQGLKERPLDQE